MSADSRIDLGLPRAAKRLIERAAIIENMTVSAFVIEYAKRAALRVIDEHEARELNRAAHLAAIEIFTAPTKRRRIAK